MNHRLPLRFRRGAWHPAPRRSQRRATPIFSGLLVEGRPDTALAATRYEDHGFSMHDRAFSSTRALSLTMVLVVLSETGDTVVRR
jgi:hypothetical protein